MSSLLQFLVGTAVSLKEVIWTWHVLPLRETYVSRRTPWSAARIAAATSELSGVTTAATGLSVCMGVTGLAVLSALLLGDLELVIRLTGVILCIWVDFLVFTGVAGVCGIAKDQKHLTIKVLKVVLVRRFEDFFVLFSVQICNYKTLML